MRALRNQETVSIWRARLQYKAYRETEGDPVPLRRAYAFETMMKELPIWIDHEQLLCGDMNSQRMSLEWFPELTAGWLKTYFDQDEEHNYVLGDAATEAELKEIAEYFSHCSAKDAFVRYMGPEWAEWVSQTGEHGSWLLGSDGGVQAQRGWNVLDYPKALKLGYEGIISQIDEQLSKLKGLSQEEIRKETLYCAMKRELKAAILFSNRYADLAEEMAKDAEGTDKQELLELAEVCRHVPEHPARTFHEALQCTWFTYLMCYWESKEAGVSMGRVDQYLYPYYRDDMDVGRTTKSQVVELLECFRVKMSARRDMADNTVRQGLSGWTQFHNCTLAGQLADGVDATNELSYLWLEAAVNCRVPHPTLSVRYHKNIDKQFAKRAMEVSALGMGFPAWFGDKASIEYLESKGATHEDALNYALAGCVLTTVPGRSAPTWPIVIHLPKVLELVLNNGSDPVSGLQLGMKTGTLDDYESYEELWNAYQAQCSAILEKAAHYENYARSFRVQILPDIFSSMFLDDCISQGKTSFEDAVVYQKTSSMYTLPVGAINVVDSLAAIKKCVYEEKSVSKAELTKALKADFVGYEDVQAKLLRAPKFGNDDDYADQIAVDFYDWLCSKGQSIEGPYGSHYECAPHNLSFHGVMGVHTSALPSGRKAGTSLVDGAVSPCHGADHCGPTAVLASAGKIHHNRILGTLLNMKFLPSALKTESDREKLLFLVHTFFEDYGGKHIQFNVIDRETLVDAKAHPENYQNLIVRVAGYSALWVELSEAIQNELIARTENSL
jgi:formate C-acetyltransferase